MLIARSGYSSSTFRFRNRKQPHQIRRMDQEHRARVRCAALWNSVNLYSEIIFEWNGINFSASASLRSSRPHLTKMIFSFASNAHLPMKITLNSFRQHKSEILRIFLLTDSFFHFFPLVFLFSYSSAHIWGCHIFSVFVYIFVDKKKPILNDVYLWKIRRDQSSHGPVALKMIVETWANNK